jgi:hypothetical protein
MHLNGGEHRSAKTGGQDIYMNLILQTVVMSYYMGRKKSMCTIEK